MSSRKKPGTSTPSGVADISTTFVEHCSFLKKYLSHFLTNCQDIEDVAQEAYLRAYQAEKNKEIDQPKAFLFRIAKNIALTELTKKQRQMTECIADLDDTFVIDTNNCLESDVEASQHLGIYCEAVANLPERCRTAFLLRKVHGLSHKEIADRMGLTVSSIEKHLHNGVLKCRDYIREREEISDSANKKMAKVISMRRTN